MSDAEFRRNMQEAVKQFGRDDFRQEVWNPFAEGMRYVSTEFASDEGEDKLSTTLSELDVFLLDVDARVGIHDREEARRHAKQRRILGSARSLAGVLDAELRL